MDNKSKITILLFALIILISLGLSLKKYYLDKNYFVEAKISCEPKKERCFIHECSEDENFCQPGTPYYYKYITKKASTILCKTGEKDCPELTCEQNDSSCTELTCSKESQLNLGTDDLCTDLPATTSTKIK